MSAPNENDRNRAARSDPRGDIGMSLMRMVDFKIPLIWLLGGFIVALTAVISMYYQLQEVSKTMNTLVQTVNASNNANIVRDGDVALMKFRLNSVEQEVDRLKSAVILQSQNQSIRR